MQRVKHTSIEQSRKLAKYGVDLNAPACGYYWAMLQSANKHLHIFELEVEMYDSCKGFTILTETLEIIQRTNTYKIFCKVFA